MDREALLCDLAEIYRIYDLRALRASQIAMYAVGLRKDSRIKMKLAGISDVPSVMLLAHIADELALIYHYLTAKKGDSPPYLFTDYLYEEPKDKEGNLIRFASGEAFMDEWKKLTEKAVTYG